MYDLYEPLVLNPNPDAVIEAEKIIKRLRYHNFAYDYQHLSYDYGGHMFVPMEFGQTKMFKGDRGKNKEAGLKARLDSLAKTLEFVAKW